MHLVIISIQVPLGREVSFIFKKNIFAVFSTIQNFVYKSYSFSKNLWKNYIYLRDTSQEKTKLEKENLRLRAENWLLNMELKKIKKIKSLAQPNFIIAEVIGIDSMNIFKSLIINKGRSDGIRKNLPVLDENHDLVGKIVEPISDNQATVQLITDVESGVGSITSETKAIGVLTGNLTKKCFFKYIYRTQEIHKGEEVLTSGMDGIFPRGIKIGRITKIKQGKDLFKVIEVTPYFQLNKLENLLVLMK
ncbi:rod shape-determining protein MreC [Candidatus Aminicenantes bacterium AC-335-O07]|nr:rod shape-determining protein MreC [Candidatus Aminicenantes bacterium AC-335-O07]